jgi:type II secretory pathway pseudopilin PulG
MLLLDPVVQATKHLPTPFRRMRDGFALLEYLLVLACMSVAIVFVIQGYQHYQQEKTASEIKNDLAIIRDALNRYYEQQGCNADGTFHGKLNPSITMDLALPSFYQKRLPIVMQYLAGIANPENLKTKTGKPIYQLQIQAVFNPKFSTQQMREWRSLFDAALNSISSNTLLWFTLPGNTIARSGTKLWVLNTSRQLFTERELDKGLSSNSFCAH